MKLALTEKAVRSPPLHSEYLRALAWINSIGGEITVNARGEVIYPMGNYPPVPKRVFLALVAAGFLAAKGG